MLMLTKIEVEKVTEEVVKQMLKLAIETEIDWEKNRDFIIEKAIQALEPK